jgi:transcription-repair coupling factor (superfamily II helicase)
MEVYDMLKRFVPGVRIGVAHGQMEGARLEQVMLDFIDGDYDVLLATTIIESGLDIPNANTIIINDAQNYGLSDLHQLRGRVGRSNKKAFCYLLSPPLSTLTSEARKRLQAIAEFADLGSGFNIAMRDLDIRGAGNILGAEQSGFISEVGIEMYQKILDEAIAELKETEFKEMYAKEQLTKSFVTDCQLETDLELLIPEDYVVSVKERLNLYKELDNIDTDAELQTFEKNLVDRFGPLPDEAAELIQAIRLRWTAKNLGIEKLILKLGNMSGTFMGKNDASYFQSDTFGKVLQFAQKHPEDIALRENKEKLSIKFEGVHTVKRGITYLMRIIEEPA